MDTLAFWLPLIFLFASALVGTVLKRRARDHCLKKFEGRHVLLPSPTGEMMQGVLNVYAQGIQLHYPIHEKSELGLLDSMVFHPAEVDKISIIIRPTPELDTHAGIHWQKEMQQILNPSIRNRVERMILNFYNMLRDAFGEAAKAILGAVSKDSSFSEVKDSSKRVDEVRSGLTELVPNAWEPILEKYRGRRVVIERQSPGGVVRESGVLEDYSSKYLLVREVVIKEPVLLNQVKTTKLKKNHCHDILFSRKTAIIRHTLAD